MSVPAYFLDTNVLVSAYLLEESYSRRLVESARTRSFRLLTNEYVIKELRYALINKINASYRPVDSFILDVLAPTVLVLKNPSHEEVRRFSRKLRDRSDIPIILPCVRHKLTLVTLDSRLAESARILVEVKSPKEAFKQILQT